MIRRSPPSPTGPPASSSATPPPANPVTIDTVTFNDPLQVLVPLTGGSINVVGVLTGAGNSSILLRSGAPILLDSDISAVNSDITLDGDVVVDGARTLSITGAGGDISITGTTNAQTVGVDTLAMSTAGGGITLGGAAGDLSALGAISFDAFGLVHHRREHLRHRRRGASTSLLPPPFSSPARPPSAPTPPAAPPTRGISSSTPPRPSTSARPLPSPCSPSPTGARTTATSRWAPSGA